MHECELLAHFGVLPACWTGSDCVSVFRLYNNNITDVGAKLVAHIIEECPKLAVLK